MNDHYLRLIVGAVSIGLIAAIVLITSQFATITETQTSLDGALSTAVLAQTQRADILEAANLEGTEAGEFNAQSTQFAEDAVATDTQYNQEISALNESATQVAIEADEMMTNFEGTATQSVAELSDDLTNVQATSEANAEAVAPLQTESAILVETATAQSDRIEDMDSTQMMLQDSLTQNADTIATQQAEIEEANNALNAIATNIASLTFGNIVESTEESVAEIVEETGEIIEEVETTEEPVAEMTTEAEMTEEPVSEITAEVEMTEEAEPTQDAEADTMDNAEATEIADAQTSDLIYESLISFAGDGYELLVPSDFLAFDLSNGADDAITDLEGLGDPYGDLLPMLSDTEEELFIAIPDALAQEDSLVQLITVITASVSDFDGMDDYLDTISLAPDRLISREVIEIDGQEVGVLSLLDDDSADAEYDLIYFYEQDGVVYWVWMTGTGDAFETQLEMYRVIGESFQLTDEE